MLRRSLIPVAALLAIASTAGFAAGGGAGVSLSFAARQQGSPVKLVSVTGDTSFLCARVDLKNISRKTIVSVTFGDMLYTLDNPAAQPILVMSFPLPTSIKPGEQQTMITSLLPPSVAIQRGATLHSTKLEAVTGVLNVKFADGSHWSFDPRVHGGFEPGRHPKPMAP